MQLVDASLFIAVAMIAAALDVTKLIEDGKEVEPVYERLPGTVCHVAPFSVTIQPRSKQAEELVSGV
jgi:hypothetical protein